MNRMVLQSNHSFKKALLGGFQWLLAYERNPEARRECLLPYGYDCCVCGFNFEKIYGEHGMRFIHVHHLKQLATKKGQHRVNPILHLRPICANCHAIVHKGSKMLKIEELRSLIEKQKQGEKLLRLFDEK